MKRLESTLSDLVSIPSITRSKEEIEILNYIEDLLNSILNDEENLTGVEVNIEKVEEEKDGIYHGAIMCNISSNNETNVGLLGHLDVVPVTSNWTKEPFILTETENKYYGRGIADMKSGCSIMIEVLRKALKDRLSKDISLIFTTGEECGMPNGLTELVGTGKLEGLDFAIALEPTGGKVNTGVFGYMDSEFIFTGKSCHSSKPNLGDNAILKIGKLIEYLKNPDMVGKFDYFGEVLEEALSATKIKGGTATNIIPDLCSIIINHRYSPSREVKEVERAFSNLGKEIGADDLKILEHNSSSNIVSANNPFLVEFMQKTKTDILNVVPFWTDISQTSSLGIPSINFGPGDIKQAQTDEEFLEKKLLEETWEGFKKYLFYK